MMPLDERTLAQAVDRAITEMNNGRISRAIPILEAVLAKAPDGYVNSEEREGKLYVRYWNTADFMGSVAAMNARGIQRDVVWIPNAFPRAAYYLGYIAIDRQRYDDAIRYLDRGLQLQPECATLAREKGYVLCRLGLYEQATSLLETALAWPSIMTDDDRAGLLRGLGSATIDQGRLDDAEAHYQASLKLDSQSKVAREQLAYIDHVRSTR